MEAVGTVDMNVTVDYAMAPDNASSLVIVCPPSAPPPSPPPGFDAWARIVPLWVWLVAIATGCFALVGVGALMAVAWMLRESRRRREEWMVKGETRNALERLASRNRASAI